MPDDGSQNQGGQIPTNLRLLLILEEVAAAGVPVKPAAIGDKLGLPKPTIHRLFHTAEAEGFLQRDLDGRSYGPGPRMRSLSVRTVSAQHIRMVRLSILKSVAEEVGETCNIAIPDREGMVYLDRVETKWPLRIQLPIGTEVPFHCTASGKMYLSSLKRTVLSGYLSARPLERRTSETLIAADALLEELKIVRDRGYSTDNEEFMEGMVAVAVPIRDDLGRVVATLSVHAPVQRKSLDQLTQFLPVLNTAAGNLASLGCA